MTSPEQQRDPNTFLGRVEAWNRSWFAWEMSNLGLRVTIATIALLAAIAIPLWLTLVDGPARERREIAKAEECFAESESRTLAYIAEVADPAEAESLTRRYEDLRDEKPGKYGYPASYCFDVEHLEMDAVKAVTGAYPPGSSWADADKAMSGLDRFFPSPSPSASVSPSPQE